MYFSSEDKEKIIQLNKDGKKSIEIAKIMAPEGEGITELWKAVYKVLEDYHRETKIKSSKSNNLHQDAYALYEEIKKLKENGLTYEQATEELKKRGKYVSVQTVKNVYIKIYMKDNKRPLIYDRKEEKIDLNTMIYFLKEKGYDFKEIKEILNKKGIDMSISIIKQKCTLEYKNRRKQHKEKDLDER